MRHGRSKARRSAAPMVAVAFGLFWGLTGDPAAACAPADAGECACEESAAPADGPRWEATLGGDCGPRELLDADHGVAAVHSPGVFAAKDELDDPLADGPRPDEASDGSRPPHTWRGTALTPFGPVPPDHGPPIYRIAPSHSPPALRVAGAHA